MNKVSIFSDLTTEEALANIEAEAQKHVGLYVDMTDSNQRKFVKDKALLINGLLKKLDRARIDKAKNYKLSIETEAGDIKARLEAANKPFTSLIDTYNEERAKVLAEEKRVEAEKLAAIQYDRDYDDATQLDRLFDLEAKDIAAQKIIDQNASDERDRLIAENAANKAREDAAQLIVRQQEESLAREEAAKQAAIDADARAKQVVIDANAKAVQDAEQAELRLKQQAEQAELDKQAAIKAEQQRQADDIAMQAKDAANREKNKAHKKKINNEAMQCFIKGGMDAENAKLAVTLLAKRLIENVVINY